MLHAGLDTVLGGARRLKTRNPWRYCGRHGEIFISRTSASSPTHMVASSSWDANI